MMYITKVHVKNFKSIEEANIDFPSLTMLVGANASGKSNLINLFRFLSNIASEGLDNAIALQGGMPYLANASLERGTPIEISFSIDLLDSKTWIRSIKGAPTSTRGVVVKPTPLGVVVESLDYSFVIQPNLRGNGYHISYDYLCVKQYCVDLKAAGKDIKRIDCDYTTVFERKNNKSDIQVAFDLSNEAALPKNSVDLLRRERTAEVFKDICNENKKELMLNRLAFLLPPSFRKDRFIRIYDFDPKELKKASSMTSTKTLDENGSNIASVLNEILRTKENKSKLTVLLNRYLPFVKNISIESNFDKSFAYKIQEKYSNKAFYASFLSDGTVSLIAIILALYFEDSSNMIILEEPERNIHPKLLSAILNSAKDVSTEKQIIITTHNPEFLKHADIGDVRLIQRDERGFSVISSPADNASVALFMQNELGLDDLFLQDLLGV